MKAETIWSIGVLVFVILLVITIALDIMERDKNIKQCAADYGGKVIAGYCVYVRDGASVSFNMRDANSGDAE